MRGPGSSSSRVWRGISFGSRLNCGKLVSNPHCGLPCSSRAWPLTAGADIARSLHCPRLVEGHTGNSSAQLLRTHGRRVDNAKASVVDPLS
jgi:hypothetical protein